jgi:hypothetical protein
MHGCMEAVKILKEQLENDEWNGDPPIALGDNMATSLSRDSDEIAIAMPGGWWVMSHEEVRRLCAHIPNNASPGSAGSQKDRP